MKKKYHKKAILLVLISILIGVILLSLTCGQVYVPVMSMFAVIGKQLNLPILTEVVVSPEQTAVIWHIRLPRILVGLLVGAALGISGAVMQGIFGNPLADPGIIGVSAGASLGAVAAVAMGITANSMFYMPLFALAGALAAVGLVVSLAMRGEKIPVMVLLLSGVAMSMLLGAMTSGILTFMNEYRLREFLFWMVGGLDYRRWEHVYLAAGPVITGIIILCLLARHLNILAMGEQEAKSVGVPVAALRVLLLVITAVTTASAVCVSGTIGFVGLIVPHVMRLLIGPDNRVLLPVCALTGGLFLVSCDALGRLISPPIEIRVGIMTALLGAPYFLYLLRQAQKEGGLF